MSGSEPPSSRRNEHAAVAPPSRSTLVNAVDDEEARVRRLEAELADAESARGRAPRPPVKGEVSPAPESPASMGPVARLMRSPAEKIKLFRELFRGRIDVYPTRFISQKTGKAGYAPACSNKFVRGVCELPKVKCGDCTKQAFRSVDASAIVAHLQGRHVMGVYPMLLDETCWFLAADFDKST